MMSPDVPYSVSGPLSAVPELRLARIRFDLESQESIDLPAYKGDVLRRALLWWLSEYWCPRPDRCRPQSTGPGESRWGCREPAVCLFGRLCEPPVDPAWPAKELHLIGDAPPPAYAVWDRQDRRTQVRAGAAWSFELMLVGELALRQVPAVVAAVQQGAERGMGQMRWRSRLCRVIALTGDDGAAPACVLADEQHSSGKPVLVWRSFRLEDIALGPGQALACAADFAAPVHNLSLAFLSPTKIKEQGNWVETPEFRAIMRAVVRRQRILNVVHGGGEWPQAAYGPLLDLAETVRLEHHETTWSSYSRYSKRSGDLEVEGFVGLAWYGSDQDLRPLLPTLWFGQWLHIGKLYVLGSGRYSLAAIP